jgi:hypothetical protein
MTAAAAAGPTLYQPSGGTRATPRNRQVSIAAASGTRYRPANLFVITAFSLSAASLG